MAIQKQFSDTLPENEGLHEDPVKDILNLWLQSKGWETDINEGKRRGIDIEARNGSKRWIIEVKGCGSRAPMRNNYFLAVLGEILQRMDDPSARYSIAFPNMDKFRRLWRELPSLAKRRTTIDALFINADGTVVEEME